MLSPRRREILERLASAKHPLSRDKANGAGANVLAGLIRRGLAEAEFTPDGEKLAGYVITDKGRAALQPL